jgi:hypothetical protein
MICWACARISGHGLQRGLLFKLGQQIGIGLLGAPVPGQALCDAADFGRGQAVDFGDFAYRHARLEPDVVCHHGGMIAVACEHGSEHGVALVPGEVDIDVGRVGAAQVEEAFEVEVVLEGADVGDVEAVGDKRRRPRAAAAGARAQRHDVAHDQKVGGKAHRRDDFEFALQALHHGFRKLAPVAAVSAGIGFCPQSVGGGRPIQPRKGREHRSEIRAGEGKARGDRGGGIQGIRAYGEAAAVLVGSGEPGVGRGDGLRRQARQAGVAVDGPQKAVDGEVVALDEITVGNGDHRHPAAAGRDLQGMAGNQGPARHRSGHRDAGVMPGREQSGIDGQNHQPVGAGDEIVFKIECLGLQVPSRQQAAEVAVALLGFHQTHGAAAASGLGDLRAHDGGDAFAPAGGQKRPQPVEVVGVGQCQAFIPKLPRGAAHLPGRGCAPHEGVMGADDEGNHGNSISHRKDAKGAEGTIFLLSGERLESKNQLILLDCSQFV